MGNPAAMLLSGIHTGALVGLFSMLLSQKSSSQ
jgi:hypothetical protein